MKRWAVFVFVFAFVFFLSGCYAARQPAAQGGCSSADARERDSCMYDRAVNSSDYGLCGNITSSSLHNGCIAEVASKTGNVGLCAESLSGKAVGYCYAQIGISSSNISLCEKNPDSFWRDTCVKRVAEELNLSGHCRSLNPSDRDECFGVIGIKRQDRALCQEVLSREPRDNCLFYVGVQTANTSVCREIEGPAIRNYCIQRIAINLREPSICEMVAVPEIRNDCYSKINSSRTEKEPQNPVLRNISDSA
ncbi:hypothetical protein HY640_01710 [Candidatus Woesearchaeota archaeon]|nr:hypothetical protein [Candidatus Woesearchaeota archaeon]